MNHKQTTQTNNTNKQHKQNKQNKQTNKQTTQTNKQNKTNKQTNTNNTNKTNKQTNHKQTMKAWFQNLSKSFTSSDLNQPSSITNNDNYNNNNNNNSNNNNNNDESNASSSQPSHPSTNNNHHLSPTPAASFSSVQLELKRKSIQKDAEKYVKRVLSGKNTAAKANELRVVLHPLVSLLLSENQIHPQYPEHPTSSATIVTTPHLHPPSTSLTPPSILPAQPSPHVHAGPLPHPPPRAADYILPFDQIKDFVPFLTLCCNELATRVNTFFQTASTDQFTSVIVVC